MTQHLSRNLVFGRAPDLSSTFSSLIGVWTNVGLPLMVIRLQIRGAHLILVYHHVCVSLVVYRRARQCGAMGVLKKEGCVW